jgi:CheY-like chemotaxis protein
MVEVRGTVLVVDDEPVNRRLLESLPAPRGSRVLQAGDGAAALEVIAAEAVDLVLIDMLHAVPST